MRDKEHYHNKEVGWILEPVGLSADTVNTSLLLDYVFVLFLFVHFHILTWLSARPQVSEPEKHLALQMANLHVRNTYLHQNTNMNYTWSKMH